MRLPRDGWRVPRWVCRARVDTLRYLWRARVSARYAPLPVVHNLMQHVWLGRWLGPPGLTPFAGLDMDHSILAACGTAITCLRVFCLRQARYIADIAVLLYHCHLPLYLHWFAVLPCIYVRTSYVRCSSACLHCVPLLVIVPRTRQPTF